MDKWKAVDLFSGVTHANVQVSSDSYQFMFVDGRDGEKPKKIFMDAAGEINATDIGIAAPEVAPEITGASVSEEDDQGLSIPPGSAVAICYSYVNEQEEESNPSPISVMPLLQYYKRGYWEKDGIEIPSYITGAEYINDGTMHGSLETISYTAKIDSDRVKRVNTYLSYCHYIEGSAAPTNFLLVSSDLVLKGATEKSVRITMPQSAVLVDYERDTASPADDVCIVDGTAFLANTQNRTGLRGTPLRVWEITVKNGNAANYFDRFHRIDLYDDTAYRPATGSYLEGLDWEAAATEKNKFRLLDTDMNTPLEVYHYPINADIKLSSAVDVGFDGSQATLETGSAEEDNWIIFSADGEAGNDITVLFRVGAQIINVMVGDDPGTELYLQSFAIEQALSIEYVVPAPSTSLSVAYSSGKITVTLATDGDGLVTTDVETLYFAIADECNPGGDLENIIDISVSGIGDGAESTVLGAVTETFFSCNATSASVDGDNVIVDLAYDSETDAITATAQDVVSATNGAVTGSGVLSAHIAQGPGYGFGLVEAMSSAESLTGGVGESTATTADIATRLLCFVKIPVFPAYSDKVLYLVEFNETDIYENPFIELVEATPGTNELTVESFYRTKVGVNSVRSEDDLYVMNPLEIPFIGDDTASPNYDNRYRLINKANANFFDTGNYSALIAAESVLERFIMPDEYARKEGFAVEGRLTSVMTGTKTVYRIAGNTIPAGAEGTLVWMGLLRQGDLLPSTVYSGAYPNRFHRQMYYVNIYLGENKNIALYYCNTEKRLFVWANTGADWTSGVGVYWYHSADMDTTKPVTMAMTWKRLIATDAHATSQSEVTLHMFDGVHYESWSHVFAMTWQDDEIMVDFARGRILEDGEETNIARLGASGTFYGWTGAVDYAFIDDEDYTFSQPTPSAISLRLEKMDIDQFVIQALSRDMPIYPTSPVGAYNEFAPNTAEDAIYFTNQNVDMGVFIIDSDNSVGRVQWGRFGAMPDLNEYSLNEEIMRIAPMKSLQPTDEHNTIIAVTKNNVYRLALFGSGAESCVAVKDLPGVGMVNRRGLVEIQGGIAFLSNRGLLLITASGIKYASKDRITLTSSATIAYDHYNNWLWVKDGSYSYIYQIDQDFWSRYNDDKHPSAFMGTINGLECFFCPTDQVMYEIGDAPTGSHTSKIYTRAYALTNKLMRFSLMSKVFTGTYSFIVKLYGKYISGGTGSSSSFVGSYNALTSAPHAKSDYAQLLITDCDDVIALKMEEFE